MKKSVVAVIHAVYWFCLIMLLFFVYKLIMQTNFGHGHILHFVRLSVGFAIVPGLIGFYTAYTWLFNSFLQRKKILMLSLLLVGVSYVATTIGGFSLRYMVGRNLLFDDGPAIAVMITLFMSVIPLVNSLIGLGMRGFITWYGDIKLKEELTKKNHETELALIRSQLDPHFLFNTLNNIDVLIELDAVKASEYLNMLSDIMRFMLYETKTEKIPVARELQYIEKYIALQKIRTTNASYVTYTIDGNYDQISVEPMLFIPFIENAFKHAENTHIENAILIGFIFTDSRITFTCKNKYIKHQQRQKAYSGIGNELIKRRLQLLFGDQYTLNISDENETYKITLTIEHSNH
jgi:two-component system, LytTR family, sensor kinase